MARENPDQEQDIQKERRELIKQLFRKYGQDTKLLIVLSNLTGKSLPEVCDEWKRVGEEIQSALHSTGKLYG